MIDVDSDGAVEVLEARAWMNSTHLILHDPATGTRRWSTSLPGSQPMGLEAAALDGVLVVATYGPPAERHAISPAPLFGLNAETGELLWTRRARGPEVFSQRIVDGALLVEHVELDLQNPRTERLEPRTGEVRWGRNAHLVELPRGQGMLRDGRLHHVSLEDGALIDLGPAPFAVHPLGVIPLDDPRLGSGIEDVLLGMDTETLVLAAVGTGSSTVAGRTAHGTVWTHRVDGRVHGGMPRHMQPPTGLVPVTVHHPDETFEVLTLQVETGTTTGRASGFATFVACDGALLVDGVAIANGKTTLHRVDPRSGRWTSTRTLSRPGERLDRRCLHDRVVLQTEAGPELLDASTLETVWAP